MEHHCQAHWTGVIEILRMRTWDPIWLVAGLPQGLGKAKVGGVELELVAPGVELEAAGAVGLSWLEPLTSGLAGPVVELLVPSPVVPPPSLWLSLWLAVSAGQPSPAQQPLLVLPPPGSLGSPDWAPDQQNKCLWNLEMTGWAESMAGSILAGANLDWIVLGWKSSVRLGGSLEWWAFGGPAHPCVECGRASDWLGLHLAAVVLGWEPDLGCPCPPLRALLD